MGGAGRLQRLWRLLSLARLPELRCWAAVAAREEGTIWPPCRTYELAFRRTMELRVVVLVDRELDLLEDLVLGVITGGRGRRATWSEFLARRRARPLRLLPRGSGLLVGRLAEVAGGMTAATRILLTRLSKVVTR